MIKNKIKNFIEFIYATKKTYILLALIIVLGATVRLYGLGDRDIWYDEALDVLQSEKSLLQIIKDVPTPIHYYFVHAFLAFGKNTFALGLPAVLFGIASLYVIFLIGKRIAGNKLGLVSAFLLALSPMHIEFSRQILHYSYFFFFGTLSAYLFINFILSFKLKPNFRYLWWLVFVSMLNILTHISSFLIIAIQLIYFTIFLFVFQKKNIPIVIKKCFPLLLFFALGVLVMLLVGGGYYFNIFTKSIEFGVNQTQELGFSLSNQLGSNVLSFNVKFFQAMFSWFGLGSGIRLGVLLFFALIGIVSFSKKKKFIVLSFMSLWIIYPFLHIYFINQSHWFEEKYFIFIIPIYLIFISQGIIVVADLFNKYIKKLIIIYETKLGQYRIMINFYSKYFSLAVILFFIFYLSVAPIRNRTVYGFQIEGVASYSWKKVYNYVNKNMKDGDRVFVRFGEGIFLDFYFPDKTKGKIWFDEAYFLSLSGDEYQSFIGKDVKNYFISIPDIEDTFIGGALKKESSKKIGGFNIYQFSFNRESEITLEKKENKWEYYYDFNNARMFSDAHDWSNFNISYIGNFNLPITYGHYNLVPGKKDNYLDYHLKLPDSTNKFYIRPVFSIEENVSFNVFISRDAKNWTNVYRQDTGALSYFMPEIKINAENGSDVFVRFSFDFNGEGVVQSTNKIESFSISNKEASGVMDYETSEKGGLVEYAYDSELEKGRNHRWIFDTISNKGWIQASDGILFITPDYPENNPLIYNFEFPEHIESVNLDTKIFAFSNMLDISYSTDGGEEWIALAEATSNDVESLKFNVDKINSKQFQLRFKCEKKGPTCQLRNLKLLATQQKNNKIINP